MNTLTKLLRWKPFESFVNSLKKYGFGFRTGSKLQEALDKNSETSIKDATVSSLKDTAKSTGSIYFCQTIFSVVRLTFLQSAIGTAIVSSTLFVSVKAVFLFLFTSLSQTFLGVLYASFSGLLSLTFTSLATLCLTLIAGTGLGKAFATTALGQTIFEFFRTAIPMIGSIIPFLVLSTLIGFIVQEYRKQKSKKVETQSRTIKS